MGGTNEKVISQSTGKLDLNLSNIRIHEKSGQVHLHDDVANLKVAIPSATFYKKWAEWRAVPTDSLTLLDQVNKTFALITSEITGSPPRLEPKIVIQKISLGDNFQKLNDFAEGR